MGSNKLQMAIEMLLKTSAFKAGLEESQRGIRKWAHTAKDEIERLKGGWETFEGKLATIGAGLGAYEIVASSAKIQHSINKIGAGAGQTAQEISRVKEEIERMGLDTGASTETMIDGFREVIKTTGSWEAAASSMEAVNTAITATDASSQELGTTLGGISKAFNFDLTKKGTALEILNTLDAAGQGSGGLSRVSEIVTHIASKANLAGLSFKNTAQFAHLLGSVVSDPEQIGTAADAVLRMFLNLKNISNVKAGPFRKMLFDETGNRRDPVAVLGKIKEMYDSMPTRGKKDGLLTMLTGGLDGRSMVALQQLLKADFSKPLGEGTLESKASQAIKDSQSQVARLRNALEHAVEPFAEKLNGAVASSIEYLTKSRQKGGLGLSGGQILIGGILATTAGLALGKFAQGALGNLISGKVGTAAGVAEGKMLQGATGVLPVFVVNFSEMSGNGASGVVGTPTIPGVLRKTGALFGLGAMGTTAAVLAGGTLLGYGIYDAASGHLQDRDRAVGIKQENQRIDEAWLNAGYNPQKYMQEMWKGFAPADASRPIIVNVKVDKDGRHIVESNSAGTKTTVTSARGSLDDIETAHKLFGGNR